MIGAARSLTDIPAERRAAARAVRADVDAIFGAAPLAGAHSVSKMRPIRSGAKRRSRAAGVGASLALGLAGIAVGALLTRDASPKPEPVLAAAAKAPGGVQVVLTPQPTVAPLKIEPMAEAKPRAIERPVAKSPAGDCARPGGRRCSYSVVLAADSSLRKAYRRAAQAGVSGRELGVYRRSWSKLRGAGSHDPDRVVRGYRAMAADLNRLARQRRG